MSARASAKERARALPRMGRTSDRASELAWTQAFPREVWPLARVSARMLRRQASASDLASSQTSARLALMSAESWLVAVVPVPEWPVAAVGAEP